MSRWCYSCNSELVLYPSGGGSEGEGLLQCDTGCCPLHGMTQPEHSGQSGVAFGSDGMVTFIRKGPVSQNEQNLPALMVRMKARLPNRYDLTLATGPERGADVQMTCSVCNTLREIQVTRAIDSCLAQTSRKRPVVWAKYQPAQLAQEIVSAVERKTQHHPVASDRSKQILAIDVTVANFWTIVLGGLDPMRKSLSGRGWHSLVLVDPAAILVLDGAAPAAWCSCVLADRAS